MSCNAAAHAIQQKMSQLQNDNSFIDGVYEQINKVVTDVVRFGPWDNIYRMDFKYIDLSECADRRLKVELEKLATLIRGHEEKYLSVISEFHGNKITKVLSLMALTGLLNLSYDSKYWRICDSPCIYTPAHWAALSGNLRAPYDHDIWSETGLSEYSVAHVAAVHPGFSPPPDSPLWFIKSRHTGITPAHIAAQYGYLMAPYDHRVWTVKDKFGNTPAHIAATYNKIDLNDYDLSFWCVKNSTGDTPGHIVARAGNLMAPYNSTIWLSLNKRGESPMHYMMRDVEVLLSANEGDIKEFFRQKRSEFYNPSWPPLVYLRLFSMYHNDDQQYKDFIMERIQTISFYNQGNNRISIQDAVRILREKRVLTALHGNPEIMGFYIKNLCYYLSNTHDRFVINKENICKALSYPIRDNLTNSTFAHLLIKLGLFTTLVEGASSLLSCSSHQETTELIERIKHIKDSSGWSVGDELKYLSH